MNRRREWEEARKTPEGMKAFLIRIAEEEREWVKTGYSDGNYARKLIEEILEKTEDPETRAVLLECSRLCPPVDPFADLAFDFDAEEKVYPIYWEPGEIVKFGRYPQGANGEMEPIEWIVLDADYAGTGKDTRLLISRYGLDRKRYNKKRMEVTWETCTLRAWLNGGFFKRAFTKEEKKRLVLTHVENPDYKWRGWYLDLPDVPGGNATEDRVFLLSQEEAEMRWFLNDEERVCCETAKIKWVSTKLCVEISWWLRSPGYASHKATYVDLDGTVSEDKNVDSDFECVRPVVVLRL